MTETELLLCLTTLWAGVATGFYIDAKREVRIAKHVMLTLVRDKEERERFFTGFEKVLGGKLND